MGVTRMANDDAPRRKLIAFDAETWNALDLLAKDSFKTVQELADEAFADLLRKHNRPTDLRQALRKSASGGVSEKAAKPAPRRSPSKGRATSAARSGRRRGSRAAE
jgi:hypothetical protein